MSMINEFVEEIKAKINHKKEYHKNFYEKLGRDLNDNDLHKATQLAFDDCMEIINKLAEEYKDVPDTNVGKWIPVSEKLPENTDPVNITWVNHKPAPYYADIKDKPFTATGCYCDGKWYWYSAVCQAYLDEYRYSENDYMDNEVEVTAWMPLPESYEGE